MVFTFDFLNRHSKAIRMIKRNRRSGLTMTERGKRMRLKRFLIATDLSSRAEKAIGRAVRLAEEHGGALTVLYILTGEAGYETPTQEIASKIEKDLRRKVEAFSPKKGSVATVRVLPGTPFVEIIRQGREEAADLIVVGAHGENFIKDLLLGTTAEKIVRKGDRSVLVIKQAAQRPYRRVLMAVDFSDHSRHALELALGLRRRRNFMPCMFMRGLKACSGELASQILGSYATSVR
jgi:nucleotide-binding universal stress UspA family protein